VNAVAKKYRMICHVDEEGVAVCTRKKLRSYRGKKKKKTT